MTQFNYHNAELYAENVAVSTLAKQFGTPLYVYSRKALETHYRAYDEAFGEHPHQEFYAVKANSNLGVLSVLAKLGAGFDIVSGGELERVLRAGGDASKVVFSGVGKTATEMEQALKAGIHCFNVESRSELLLLNQVAERLGVKAPISIHVNPDVDACTHPYISTGLKENKFGVDIALAPALYQEAATLEHLHIIGVDCHIGSQLTELGPFEDALHRVMALMEELKAAGITLEHLNLGGGLGVRYRDEVVPTPQEYVARLLEHLPADLPLHIEPGRSIAANAGIFVTQVLYTKPNEEKNFAIVDGAMNDLIRPSLYSAWQNIIPVAQRQDVAAKSWDVVGPVCETGDFLGKERELALDEGDLLVVCSAGAYGFSMASNYNTRNRAAEVIVDGDNTYLVRQRETYDDQLRLETALA